MFLFPWKRMIIEQVYSTLLSANFLTPAQSLGFEPLLGNHTNFSNLAVGKVKGANQLCEKEVHESAVISSRGSASEFTDNRSSVESVVNSHAFELGAFGIRDMQTNQIPLHNPVSATMSAPPC